VLKSAPFRETTMYFPSGVHSGDRNCVRSVLVICRAFLPLASMTQTSSDPSRSLTKTICRPSGDQRGWASKAIPSVIRVALPPPIGTV
jgi:hypothetical protein